MCLTQTMLDDPDISKPSSSGSSLTEMIVSLPTPPYRTGVLQNVLLHWIPHSTSIASDAPRRKNTYPVGSRFQFSNFTKLFTAREETCGARSFRDVLSDNNTAACLARAEHTTCKQKSRVGPHGASGL